jgi:hypothetical protein
MNVARLHVRLKMGESARFCAFIFASAALAACSHSVQGGAEGEVGSARLEIQVVPSGVQCIRINLTAGGASRSNTFSVQAAQTASFAIPSIPSGSAVFSGEAFNLPCAQVTSNSLPTWTAAPVTVPIASGAVASVNLVMKVVGSATVGVDFGGGSGGSSSSGGSTGSGGSGGSGAGPGVWDLSNFDNSTWQ